MCLLVNLYGLGLGLIPACPHNRVRLYYTSAMPASGKIKGSHKAVW